MTDRVLHQRLQDQIGYSGLHDIGGDVHLDAQPVAEARVLDAKIGVEELELDRQGHDRRLTGIDR